MQSMGFRHLRESGNMFRALSKLAQRTPRELLCLYITLREFAWIAGADYLLGFPAERRPLTVSQASMALTFCCQYRCNTIGVLQS